MASIGLNTIAVLDIWTVSFLEAPCSCCKRERPHSAGGSKREYQIPEERGLYWEGFSSTVFWVYVCVWQTGTPSPFMCFWMKEDCG